MFCCMILGAVFSAYFASEHDEKPVLTAVISFYQQALVVCCACIRHVHKDSRSSPPVLEVLNEFLNIVFDCLVAACS